MSTRATSIEEGGRQGAAARRGLLLSLGAYVLATAVTDASVMADTIDYVGNVVDFERGTLGAQSLLEFGHLYWRPLGFVLHQAFGGLAARFVGPGAHVQVTFLLVALNWLLGLLGVGALYGVARRATRHEWVAALTSVFFVFTHAFLNFTQSGTSYTAALSLLLLGLYLLARGAEASRRAARLWALAAGAALAAAVCVWLPFVLALPAAALSPLFLFGNDRERRWLVVEATLACALCGALAYGLAAAGLGLYTPAGVKAWVASSPSVGTTETRGAARVVFGLARSFINMGNDGLLFKRYLIHDPFSPVTLTDLLRLSLWKLVLFYVFLGALLTGLIWTPRGRGALALFGLVAAPILFFAVRFDGGAVERYLPLYPFLLLAFACAWREGGGAAWRRYAMLAFVAACVLINSVALAKPVLRRQQERIAARVVPLEARLKPASQVYTVNWQDELVNFNRSFPFHPANRRSGGEKPPVNSLVTPGTAWVPRWREEFAARALDIWGKGGDVWVSRRVLSERPRPEWGWAEGDDRRVSWTDFYRFFSQLETGENVGGEDGFLLLTRSPHNEQLLNDLARGHV